MTTGAPLDGATWMRHLSRVSIVGQILILVSVLTVAYSGTVGFIFWSNGLFARDQDRLAAYNLATVLLAERAEAEAFELKDAAAHLAASPATATGESRPALPGKAAVAYLYVLSRYLSEISRLQDAYGDPNYAGTVARATLALEKMQARAPRGVVFRAGDFIAIEDQLDVFVTSLIQLGAFHTISHAAGVRRLVETRTSQARNLAVVFAAVFVFSALLIGVVLANIRAMLRRSSNAEAEIRWSRQNLKEAQELAHVGSWNRDHLGDVGEASDEHYRILGYEPQAHAPKYDAFRDRLHPDDREEMDKAIAALFEHGTRYHLLQRIVRPDGAIRYIENIGAGELCADGRPVRVSGTLQDITERKRAEDEIRSLNEDLEGRVQERTAELEMSRDDLGKALDDLKTAQDYLVQSEKMASLGGLVAGVAHEINTPVGVAVTAASHLQDRASSIARQYDVGEMKRSDLDRFLESCSESLSIVMSNLRRASELVGSFKRVAVDQTSAEARRFAVRAYLEEILLSLRPHLNKHNHTVNVNCDPNLEIFCDPGALSQIITNLLMNALNHAFENCEAGQIDIEVAAPDFQVELSFADNGCGMTEENAAKAFDPFFTTKRGSGGSGLGLNILYNVVTRSLGGTVSCVSELGKGTVFSIAFPIVEGEERQHVERQVR